MKGRGRKKRSVGTYVRLLPFAIPPAVAVAGLTVGPDESSLRFYEIAAQIIPVLLLVLAVEGRIARLSALRGLRAYIDQAGQDVSARVRTGLRMALDANLLEEEVFLAMGRTVYGAVVVLFLAVGEVAALHPVINQSATDGNFRFVFAAILGGLAAISVFAFFGWPSSAEDAHDDS